MSARRTKFYLDKRNGKMMGVCAGIADYTGIDVTWVRVGVVLLTLLGGFPWTLIAYGVAGAVAGDLPREFADTDPEEAKFWQGVRAKPGRSIRDVRSRFRDIDRRLADVETHVTSHNSRLAREIDALR
ncbi:envelope stress response membrane protein PspC [Sphingomonas solaris]|uniref:Envelope stress response membrane protein PspC n=1 Tax=Alterirhizorhabdus solaris TaxID=2529389 RepID=A0A558R1V2_9SPHN|nr:envelope stress response membrane protein PspC [Sphingomonas solaris]TVV73366.1 envelope stress response membrane protein PspC [Sphingomonas solaris]